MKNALSGILVFLLSFSLLFTLSPGVCASEASEPILSARSAVLYEATSDKLLFEKNANARLPMASTTKIMTALAVLTALSPDDTFPFPPSAVGVEGSSAYLKAGEVLSVRDMLYALLLQSANDVAVALAILSDGTPDAFAERMNRLAAEYGCKDTHFVNPHGLHSDDHYTTAHDLAIIAKHLLENELLRSIVKTKVYTANTSLERRTFVNHNKLLSHDGDAIGIKTGFTKNSGRCLVGAAQKEGMLLISVTLNAPNDWSDHERLWSFATSRYEFRCELNPKEYYFNVSLIGALVPYLTVTNKDAVRFLCRKDEAEIKMHPELLPLQVPPIKAGDCLGRLVFTQNGKEIYSLPLYATADVMRAKT